MLTTSSNAARIPFTACLLALATACSAPPTAAERADLILDSSANHAPRISAVDSAWKIADETGMSDADMRRQLKTLAWRRSEFWKLRAAAIDQLLADDPADTANMIRLMLPTETQWPIIERCADLAVEHQWTETIPGFVASWARPVKNLSDLERPERTAVAGLADQPVADTVFQVFAGDDPATDAKRRERDRIAAYALLQRIDANDQRTAQLIANLPPTDDDPILVALRDGHRDLMVVPRTAEELRWLVRLRAPEQARFWADATETIAALEPERRDNLALRHPAVLLRLSADDPERLSIDRRTLIDRAVVSTEGARHYNREGVATPIPTIDRVRGSLSWPDALALTVALDAIRDPGVRRTLFAQAEADMADGSTEYGGVITTEGGGVVALGYPPRPAQRVSDTQFIPSADLIEASDTALLVYHFHAQVTRNERYAAPSAADVDTAVRLGRTSLVFTFIDDNSLNADLYFPTGTQIDLGTITRPVSGE